MSQILDVSKIKSMLIDGQIIKKLYFDGDCIYDPSAIWISVGLRDWSLSNYNTWGPYVSKHAIAHGNKSTDLSIDNLQYTVGGVTQCFFNGWQRGHGVMNVFDFTRRPVSEDSFVSRFYNSNYTSRVMFSKLKTYLSSKNLIPIDVKILSLFFQNTVDEDIVVYPYVFSLTSDFIPDDGKVIVHPLIETTSSEQEQQSSLAIGRPNRSSSCDVGLRWVYKKESKGSIASKILDLSSEDVKKCLGFVTNPNRLSSTYSFNPREQCGLTKTEEDSQINASGSVHLLYKCIPT